MARPAQRPARPSEPGPTTSGSGCRSGPFESVGLWAPRPARRAGGPAIPARSRAGPRASRAYYWTVREFVRETVPAVPVRRGRGRAVADRRPRRAGRVATSTAECEDDPEHDATVVLGGLPGAGLRASCASSIREQLEDDDARLARPAVRRAPSPRSCAGSTRRGSADRPPDLGPRRRGPGAPPHRLGGQPGHGRSTSTTCTTGPSGSSPAW